MGVRLFSPRIGATAGATTRRAGSRVGQEAAAVVLVAAACYLALALGSLEQIEGQDGNWVGPVGAWLASLLAGAFGIVAWLLPLELVLIAAPLIRHRELQPLGIRLAAEERRHSAARRPARRLHQNHPRARLREQAAAPLR